MDILSDRLFNDSKIRILTIVDVLIGCRRPLMSCDATSVPMLSTPWSGGDLRYAKERPRGKWTGVYIKGARSLSLEQRSDAGLLPARRTD